MKSLTVSVFSILLITSLVIILLSSSAYAESESFIVAARSYDDFPVFMNSGDQISFAISVRGGSDDDIFLTLYSPTGSKLIDGVVYDQFSDNFSAMNSGTYTFRFDNTGSTISNKAVNFSHVVKINTYYVYVDPLPDWAIYPGSTVYDSTKAWKDANPNLNFYQADSPENANLRIQWVKEFGVEHVGYAYGSHFIEVGLGDSNCTGDWQPFSTDHVNWIMKHEIGHVLGLDHSSDPASIMYPTAPSAQYGMIEEQFTLTEGYTQFVPFCYSKSITDFSYSVSTDDPTYGFDVYVIPSVNEFHKSIDGNSFRHYSSSECFGEGYLKYSGTCRGLSQGSGLLVALDIRQSNGLTKLTVQQQESSISSTSLQPTTSTTISYDYPEVYEEDSQSLDDIFSELEKEQISFENKKTTPIVEPDNSKQIIYPKLNVNLDETFEEIYNINKNTECGYDATLVNGYCLNDQLADEIAKLKKSKDTQDSFVDTTTESNTESLPNMIIKDLDEDGIPDYEDKCIFDKETFNGIDDRDGCPDVKSPASFVDTTKDPKSYIQRYVTEDSYKTWFEENYPEYTFDEALGITKPQFNYLVKEVKNSNSETQLLENSQMKNQCGSGTHLENNICVLDKQVIEEKVMEEKTCFLFWCW